MNLKMSSRSVVVPIAIASIVYIKLKLGQILITIYIAWRSVYVGYIPSYPI